MCDFLYPHLANMSVGERRETAVNSAGDGGTLYEEIAPESSTCAHLCGEVTLASCLLCEWFSCMPAVPGALCSGVPLHNVSLLGPHCAIPSGTPGVQDPMRGWLRPAVKIVPVPYYGGCLVVRAECGCPSVWAAGGC